MPMRALAVLAFMPVFAADLWLARMEPLMSPAEKKAYLALAINERRAFEENFWNGRLISQDDYLQRAASVDESFGSGKPGSGANTDRGRVYLSIGPPNRMSRLASSRTFFPIEIWYYAEAANLGIHYELQLLFYQRNGTGEYKLYSPNLNTIRDLMNPQASTRGMFGVNDVVTESDIRTRITLSPGESEVIDAAVSVARGIKGMGNEEILAMVASPSRALSRDIQSRANNSRVTSRLVTDRPALATFQTASADGVPQIDFAVESVVRESIAVEVQEGSVTLARYETAVHFNEAKLVRYEQRLELLPGDYRVLITADGRTHAYPLAVNPPERATSAMLTGTLATQQRARTPYEFRGRRVSESSVTEVAVIEIAQPGQITWRLRKGIATVWITRTSGEGIVVQQIGDASVPPGAYTLEASANGEIRSQNIRIGGAAERTQLPVISYNANLAPPERYRSLGHQWLARGNATQAKVWLERAWAAQPDVATRIELCRVAALTGHYDEARADLEVVLANDPDNFEALSTLAYVEAGLQDYAVAERLYTRALAIRKSPAIEKALASLRQLKQ